MVGTRDWVLSVKIRVIRGQNGLGVIHLRTSVLIRGKGFLITSLIYIYEYTKNNKQVLMCAVRNQEVYKIRDIVKEIDPDAFIIISEAGEILGEGFKDLNKKNTTI